jgi:alkanesulfonate monooxygenase SsuD/methylene tetrahydromethanopterin reductase-like flavin-dependent oxidoreductase (luciferase family)
VSGRRFPARRERHELLREALEIIRLRWRGGYRSYDGMYLRLEDARVFDLPERQGRVAFDPASASRQVTEDGDYYQSGWWSSQAAVRHGRQCPAGS